MSDKQIDTMFVHGRSEAAMRVERTAQRLGLEVVGGEVAGPHPLTPDAEALVALAKSSGAQMLHPGYVAPETRATLCRRATEEGLVFLGPSLPALELLADKLSLRAFARALDVHVVPGVDRALEDASDARRAMAELDDDPVMLKPVAGTSGIGVTRVDDEDDLEGAFEEARSLAMATFGDGRLYMERAVLRPRQLEVAVVADSAGNVAILGERECSIQRGHRVVVAESPSPYLDAHSEGEAIRELMIDVAHRFARTLSLSGILTLELLVDADARVWFLEANADMQGALLATEMLTGVDPVELAIDIARGEAVVDETKLVPSGHAFDVRLCAVGHVDAGTRIEELRFPAAPHGRVRVDALVEPGDTLSGGVDPVLARIATFAPGRHDALLWLDRVLAETSAGSLATNAAFVRRILGNEAFRAGQYDVSFTERMGEGT